MQGRRIIIALEIIGLSLVIGLINFFFAENPGFNTIYYIPYIAASILVATIYGAGWGFLTFAICGMVIGGLLPASYLFFIPDWSTEGYWANLLNNAYIPASAGLLAVYVFGVIRTTSLSGIGVLKRRVEDLAKENWLLKRKSDALYKVNLELDERVSRQQDSITSLHTQLRKLDTLDVTQALTVLLETVQIFTRATKASVWRYDEVTTSLKLAASIVSEEDEAARTSLPIDGTIEGWVYRNDNLFSVRMLLQYDNLEKMDMGRNIITIPISFERRIWGVLNIQEMPFEKYNFYSEKILQIIVSLAEHSLERAVSYEAIIQQAEVDDKTGLPLFSQFYRMLEEETRVTGIQKGSYSIILVEFINYEKIQTAHGSNRAKELLRNIVAELEILSDRRAHFFQYKNDSQIALLFPGLDFDGVSLFSLETLEKINTGNWEIEGAVVRVEAVIGFSVFSGEGQTADQVLEQAENLLEMQKV